MNSFKATGFYISNCSAPINGGAFSLTGNIRSLYLQQVELKNNAVQLLGGSLFLGGSFQTVIIEGGSIAFNSAGYGSGLYLIGNRDGNLEIRNVTFDSNAADNRGAGIYSKNLNSILILDCNFTNNRALVSGGASHFEGSFNNFTMENVQVVGNQSPQGGGLDFENSQTASMNINNCLMSSNTASNLGGGAMYVQGSFNISMRKNTFDGNQSPQGGAILLSASSSNSSLFMESNNFKSNQASVFYGGAVHINGKISYIEIYDSSMSNNYGESSAGALSLQVTCDYVQLNNCTFTYNQANLQGGAISLQLRSKINRMDIINCTMRENTASSGAAIYLPSNVDDLTISGSKFYRNLGDEGGAIQFDRALNLTVLNSSFGYNLANLNGGAWKLSTLSSFNGQVNGCTFEGNRAGNGGALYINAEGTKRSTYSSQLRIGNSSFDSNVGSTSGGSILLNLVEADIIESSFRNNTSPLGSSVLLKGGTLHLFNGSMEERSLYLALGANLTVEGDGNLSFLYCDGGKMAKMDEERNVYCENIIIPSSSNNININNNIIYNNSPLSTSAIVGIAVGGSIFVLLIIIVFVLMMVRIRRQRILRRRNNFSLIDFSKVNLGDAKNSILDFDDFRNMVEVGSGAFGVVFRADWRELKIAVKQIKNENVTSQQVTEFLREVSVIRGLRSHPNVVLFLGITFPPQNLSLVTEFCEMGSLYDYLRTNQISLDKKMEFIYGISKGMLHLHLEKIIHRDLACRNILLSKHLEPKVSDFGLSRESQTVETGAVTSTAVGPLKWMAPESITRREYSSKSDVWAFGVCIWEIIYVQDPFPEMTPLEAALSVTNGNRLKISEGCPNTLEKLMKDCWETMPDNRPDFNRISSILGSGEIELPYSPPKQRQSEIYSPVNIPKDDHTELS
eukprot:TRINITY_DN4883_c0_g1_i1.p1 TRINITY_DN4883_c0_g1~~TRINITY_DN4883_c0_g1_i1.p1  ORF type:complete len:906 (-),score=213.57 TRINITY_DN4883_c0_g1_i1:66-2783(-)